MKSRQAALKDVILHPEIGNTIAERAALIPDWHSAETLSPEAIRHLCLAFPIRAVAGVTEVATDSPARNRHKRRVYFCVGGLRTFQIAKTRLPSEVRVPVLVQDEADGDIGGLALRELFLGTVALGILGDRSAAQLEGLRTAIPRELLLEFHPSLKSRNAMATALKLGRTALAPRKAGRGAGIT